MSALGGACAAQAMAAVKLVPQMLARMRAYARDRIMLPSFAILRAATVRGFRVGDVRRVSVVFPFTSSLSNVLRTKSR